MAKKEKVRKASCKYFAKWQRRNTVGSREGEDDVSAETIRSAARLCASRWMEESDLEIRKFSRLTTVRILSVDT